MRIKESYQKARDLGLEIGLNITKMISSYNIFKDSENLRGLMRESGENFRGIFLNYVYEAERLTLRYAGLTSLILAGQSIVTGTSPDLFTQLSLGAVVLDIEASKTIRKTREKEEINDLCDEFWSLSAEIKGNLAR